MGGAPRPALPAWVRGAAPRKLKTCLEMTSRLAPPHGDAALELPRDARHADGSARSRGRGSHGRPADDEPKTATAMREGSSSTNTAERG